MCHYTLHSFAVYRAASRLLAGALPSSFLSSNLHQRKRSDTWLLPPLRHPAARRFINYVNSPLERWEGAPVVTSNEQYIDTCLVLAERLAGCTDLMWQGFRLKLLGHLYGIRLTIPYTDAMGVPATCTTALGRDYYQNEQDQLRTLLGCQACMSRTSSMT